MNILGIETSCDDTGIAILEARKKPWPSFRILSNVVTSQIEVHKKYGGVYPSLAKREHIANLPIVLAQALKKAKTSRVDAIAVTYGPGLSPCLWTGINFAKKLAQEWKVPLIPTDHMEGHLLVGLFTAKKQKPQFPAIALLISGGHTQLLLTKGIGKYQLLGETRDDAAGEAFDKTARILGLSYPGGPAIAKLAAMAKSNATIKLPRPMLHTKDFDFSFSGLKTAVLYDYQKRTKKVQKSQEYIQAMAQEIQRAICDVVVKKTLAAAWQYKAKTIILGGGVAANKALRNQLEKETKKEDIALFLPEKSLATDNGIMPALAGYFLFQKKEYPKNAESLEANPNLKLE
jgi:N6-L-threonylcarbamoyladenine synthase